VESEKEKANGTSPVRVNRTDSNLFIKGKEPVLFHFQLLFLSLKNEKSSLSLSGSGKKKRTGEDEVSGAVASEPPRWRRRAGSFQLFFLKNFCGPISSPSSFKSVFEKNFKER